MNLPHSIGLQKTSLIDYPGKVATVLFLPGCNMRCSYCHNSDLALGKTEELLNRDDVIDFVKNRAPLLGGVVISGGEPLLHEGISDLIALFHNKLGLSVKLDTNGMLPERLESLIDSENKPDFIAMDLKSIPSNYTSFSFCSDAESIIKRSMKLINESKIPSQYRTTVHSDYINIDMLDELSELLQGCQDYVLNPFMPGNCLNPDYNNHPGTTVKELLSLQEGFISRGINCRVPSVQNCCNPL
ncbi:MULTISPECIES: anaerobic ribonucleoside-triphosphate reductase activating protein [unclassified Oceanispirochaeta]|uniref:anaerobic ribonucleoside-triphosphate reductase activating protein n=1 Tax=unclassified Oceanispirochaeta TaxID=2635722 RepID=UPI000E098C0B|nr:MULTISPECIES: anaerobic ribonucleoside-triphosphate reductase activating protein [unclassified Oceanispirochaeta]MBF9015539.1 anaerobic ribonucleoside-triphosphate reductase activating protein [Oceanispirochaeta sp. M2]NPD73972.1 anaerobic ribonucleoside-triphosphate reductase activating protein [Oceanispirochaeta sp. M1]RDG30282.1 anaerobic ribonucleoside-triphosphate reductase activating protein [Oceanispirochaeta sp. M1]